MPDFSNGVATPGGASYMAPLLNFSDLGNLGSAWQKGRQDNQQVGLNDQQKAMNEQRIAEAQRQADLAKTFQGGLPIDPQTGQIDYKKAVAMLAQKGDINALWNGADAMLSQSATNMSPMLTGGGQPQGQPQAQPQGQPSSVPAKPLPAPTGPQGDSGSGTITSMVTDKLPSQNQTTGQTIMKIAEVMGIDPNATLTPGQIRRAQGLLKNYAPEIAGVSGGGGSLPPSANAGTPAPQITRQPPAQAAPGPVAQPAPQQPPQAAPIGAGAPGQPAPQPQPVAAPPAQPPQGGPIVPQVPLPKGFNDPQQAILALKQEAARLSANPRAKGQVDALNDWANRIEESIKPLSVNSMTTMVDPRTGKPVFQGAGAAAIAAAGQGGASLDADAQRYRQTGTLPPNMGRGAQGAAEAQAIRSRAAEQEINEGGDPSKWPSRWQDYRAAGVGKNTAERTKASREENLNLILKAADAAIPAALEASKNLPRGDYVPLNKLIQKGEVMSSNPALVEFGMANLQLAEHWARAMNPTGVMRESDRDKALSFLDTAYGNNTYERAVMQLQKQITRERDAVRGGGTILKDSKAPDPGAEGKDGKETKGAATKVSPAGVSWSIQ